MATWVANTPRLLGPLDGSSAEVSSSSVVLGGARQLPTQKLSPTPSSSGTDLGEVYLEFWDLDLNPRGLPAEFAAAAATGMDHIHTLS